jgi:hypothetical protein
MSFKNIRTVNIGIALYISFACFGVGILTEYVVNSYSVKRAEKIKAAQVEIKKEPNWSSVENINFDLDMKTMGVTLVKRTFDEQGEEATLIECGSSNHRYFMCSRDIHEKLVKEFQELLEARKAETP